MRDPRKFASPSSQSSRCADAADARPMSNDSNLHLSMSTADLVWATIGGLPHPALKRAFRRPSMQAVVAVIRSCPANSASVKSAAPHDTSANSTSPRNFASAKHIVQSALMSTTTIGGILHPINSSGLRILLTILGSSSARKACLILSRSTPAAVEWNIQLCPPSCRGRGHL